MLTETLDMLVMEVLGKFDFNFFKKLAANNVRPRNKDEEEDFAWRNKSHPEIVYAKQMLPLLGKGSSRITFALSGGKALKVSFNKAGEAQNQAEVEISRKNLPLVTKVFDTAPDYKWIVSEIVKPFNERGDGLLTFLNIPIRGYRDDLLLAKIMEKAATVHPDHLDDAIMDLRSDRVWDLWNTIKTNPKVMKFFEDLKVVNKMGDVHPGEFIQEHFGTTVDGQIRLLDYGGTNEVIDAHY